MLRLLLFQCCFLLSVAAFSKTIVVKDTEELKKANKAAVPGDTVILQNGVWNNISIGLNCNGTKEQPILFKAETTGKVVITGNSKLKIGGNYIIIDGLYFTNGYAGDDAVITFRTSSKELANNCRVTNTTINDFNNPKRLDENYWIAFYGKYNQLDHCSFLNKKNIGVLLAVILDDDRSRENYHKIDHNYFGVRLPLASNGGEIIRVGVSQHCEFNSFTQITDNFFEHCDGETEIISIKSCRNTIRYNLFKECQGSVVLRHGNYNDVESNVFYGNNKEGTGGVRIINKGQWVVNNLFYKCRGEGFRSPLSIMNGVPNSPANRYVEVSEAVIANNSFFDCTPISFCEGSDTERSVIPHDVNFLNNIFYNTRDSIIYRKYDDISGISFKGNMVSRSVQQILASGFSKAALQTKQVAIVTIPFPASNVKTKLSDSLLYIAVQRLANGISVTPGFADKTLFLAIQRNANTDCGAKWFNYKNPGTKKRIKANCKSAEEIAAVIKENKDAVITINLTAKEYYFTSPLFIDADVVLTAPNKTGIKFISPSAANSYFIQVRAGNTFSLTNLSLDLSAVNAHAFITTDTSGSSNHSNIKISNCHFVKYNGTFFNAAKSSVADSILITNCGFANGNGTLFNFISETDRKGYYNVEKLVFTGNAITGHTGQVLAMLRGGNDESTMGPLLIFRKNAIFISQTTAADKAMIELRGVQKTFIEENYFQNCNKDKGLIEYKDEVRALHIFGRNVLIKSGIVITNKFVTVKK